MECLALELQPARTTGASATRHVESEAARLFEQLVADEQPRVTRLVRRLLGWPDDVDDVVQDVFLSALRGWTTFRRESLAATWLTRIAVNCCRSHARRRRLGRGALQILANLARGGIRLGRHDDVVETRLARSAWPDAELRAVADETAEEVRSAVLRLPQRDREVIVLHYLEELPIEQVATLLDASRGAIDIRLSRARKRLRAILAPETPR